LQKKAETMKYRKGISGNPKGKAKGTKNKKTLAWESMAVNLTTIHTDHADKYLFDLWATDKEAFFKAYVMLIEYFKPKLARTENKNEREVIINWHEQKTYEK